MKYATFAYNVSPREKTKYSPFETILGFKAEFEPCQKISSQEKTIDEYFEQMQNKKEKMYDLIFEERQMLVEQAEEKI